MHTATCAEWPGVPFQLLLFIVSETDNSSSFGECKFCENYDPIFPQRTANKVLCEWKHRTGTVIIHVVQFVTAVIMLFEHDGF